MTAQSRALETAEPLMRWQAVASIIRKDMQRLGPYALAGAIWMVAMSALFHTDQDFSALMASLGISGLGLDFYLFALFGIGPPVALTVFVILLAQANVASDTRHDWLIRPVTPLELVASKVVTICCVIVAPMIAGNVIYMMVKAAPLEEAFAFFLLILTCCVLVLVLSWLVSTPFRAVLALLLPKNGRRTTRTARDAMTKPPRQPDPSGFRPEDPFDDVFAYGNTPSLAERLVSEIGERLGEKATLLEIRRSVPGMLRAERDESWNGAQNRGNQAKRILGRFARRLRRRSLR